jgi:hypothetical protein
MVFGEVTVTVIFGFMALLNFILAAVFGYGLFKYVSDNIENKFETCFGTSVDSTKKYLKDSLIAGVVICGFLGFLFSWLSFVGMKHKTPLVVIPK